MVCLKMMKYLFSSAIVLLVFLGLVNFVWIRNAPATISGSLVLANSLGMSSKPPIPPQRSLKSVTKKKTKAEKDKETGINYARGLFKPDTRPDSEVKDLNETLFTFVTEPKVNCQDYPAPVVFFLKSTVTEFEPRQAIRDSWGKLAKDEQVSVIFVVGEPDNSLANKTDVAAKIKAEAEQNEDILMAQFMDVYDHMPFKTLSTLTWYTKFCFTKNVKRKPLLFSTDTDVIVFPDNVKKLARRQECFGAENTITGHCWLNGAPVNRNKKDPKHYVSTSVWSATHYPPYCSGSGFMLTPDVPEMLLKTIPKKGRQASLDWIESFEHLNDILYTGVLTLQAGVHLHHTTDIWYWKVSKVDKCDRNFLSSHDFKPPSKLKEMWRKFREGYMEGCRKKNEW